MTPRLARLMAAACLTGEAMGLAVPAQASAGPVETRLSVSAGLRPAVGTANLDTVGPALGGMLGAVGDARLPTEGGTLSTHVDTRLDWVRFRDPLLDRHVVREAYVQWQGSGFDLLVGRRMLLWGTGDGFNPTSTLAGSDFRTLSHDLNGDRFGTDVAQLTAYAGSTLSVTALALPRLRPSLLPSGLLPPFLQSLPMRGLSGFGERPGGALRMQYRGQGLDAALVAHVGYDATPVIALSPSGAPTWLAPRLTMVGGDMALMAGQLRLFAEASYRRYRMDGVLSGFLPRDEAAFIAGGEYTLESGDSVQLQLYGRHFAAETPVPFPTEGLRRINRVSHGQFGRSDYGAIASTHFDFASDNAALDLSAATSFTRSGLLLNARLKYRVDDHLSLYLRGDHLSGPDDSPFGSLRTNSRAFIEFRIAY